MKSLKSQSHLIKNNNGPVFNIYLKRETSTGDLELIKIIAFIDTGATESVIDIELVEKLKLPATNKRDVLDTKGYSSYNAYDIGVSFNEENINPFKVNATGMDLSNFSDGNLNIRFIVGRDILNRCIFTYNGIDKTFTIEY